MIMQSRSGNAKNFLLKDLQNYQPDQSILSQFKKHYESYLSKLDQAVEENESEEHRKTLFRDFLKDSFPEYRNINTHQRIDALIKDKDDLPRVLIEIKRTGNLAEMLTESDFNRKALHQALFYFFRLRHQGETFRLNYIMITDCEQIYLFSARQFDELCKNKKINSCLKPYAGKNSGSAEKTDDLYKQLRKILYDEKDLECHGVNINLREYQDEEQCKFLWKFLSPYTLFKEPLSNDANHLNERFYAELLHILGLREKKEKNGLEYNSDPYSMMGCIIETLKVRAKIPPEAVFETAFELSILWLNRILFLKILEALLVGFSGGAFPKFLDENKIKQLSDLATLFFRVLAVKREDRAVMENIFPNIPYLNSSLFEETETERLLSIDQVAMYDPMDVMRGSILKDKETKLRFLVYLIRFLNCYQFNKDAEFTDKNTVISSAVLGLVFEKLNGYRDGAHFTPARITMYMARRVIHQLVLRKFNEKFNKKYQSFEKLKDWIIKLDDHDQEVRQAREIINGIRIFDPAVGSGHFLVSCLNELIKVKSDLRLADNWHEYEADIQNDELVITHFNGEEFHYVLKDNVINRKQQIIQQSLFEAKLRIIENQLYGIDINPNSVNICRLRLWIELLKHTYYTDEKHIDLRILPNLEFKVMTANSIVRLEQKQGELVHSDYHEVLDKLRESFNGYFEAGLEDKRELRNNIQQSLEKIKNMRIGAEGNTEEYITQFDPFHLNVSNPFFDSGLMFGVKNFDIVIGNPPYMQLQGLKKGINPYIGQGFETYAAEGDIYQLFIERAFNWITEEGIAAFVVSNKWMRAKYGQKTRAWLYKNAEIDELIDIGAGWFDSATVDTNIIVYHKKTASAPRDEIRIPAGHSLDKALDGMIVSKENGDAWIITDEEEEKILRKIRANGTPLKNWDVSINYGIKTGYNKAFIIDQAKYDELTAADPKSVEILKPLLQGKDIRRWGYTWGGVYLIGTLPSLKINIDNYPDVKLYLESFGSRLEQSGEKGSRKKTNNKWFETQDTIAYWEEFKKPKIIWGNLNLRPGFALDTEQFYICAPCNLLTLQTDDIIFLKALLAVLNSKVSHFYLNRIAYSRNGGYQEYKPIFVEQIPVPELTDDSKQKLSRLIDQIYADAPDNEDIQSLEQEIDRIVYRLYHLTDDEIAALEKKI